MTRSPFPNSPYDGGAFKTALDGKFKQLYDAAVFPLTAIGGTANAVTATLTPALDGSGLLDGMGFTLTWAATNTAGMTLAINGGSPLPIVGHDGLALPAGSIGAGLRGVLSYASGQFVLVSPSLLMVAGANAKYYWQFVTSGTWTKPAGLLPDAMVTVEAWGAGGGGAVNGSGGGGGGYMRREFRASTLPSSLTVTVAGGTAIAQNGQSSSFGSFLIAPGGLLGVNGASVQGGLGSLTAGLWNGGVGNFNGANGGSSIFGGGGGAELGGTGGVSTYGGNGGAQGVSGTAPGGGGGRNAAGARGEIRVWA